MDTHERRALIRRYAEGPAVLKAALAEVPAEAMRWRPGPGKWSAHEVVLHCADSETNSYARIRYVLAEEDPLIVGYDQDRWAKSLDYHALPLEPALAAVTAVRGATVPLLEGLPDAAWARKGRHTEHAEYGAEKWLRIYAEHLEVHANQIRKNVEAWKASRGARAR